MRKIISAIILLALSGVSVNAFSGNGKEEVCHKGKEISISQSAVNAHLNHGDTLGDCDGDEFERDFRAAVVMMRCSPITGNGVVVVSASSSVPLDVAVILPFPHEVDTDCARAMAGLLNAGFRLKSITTGSAGDGDTLRLFLDYLFLGKTDTDS